MGFWTKKKIDAAEVYAKGEEFYSEKNYDKAVECYKTAAKHGHADAMFSLGRMYEEGTGVELDYIRAVSYYEKAVRLGSIDSMVMLGNCYVSGTGVSIDYDRAIEIWSIAAERGSKEAQHNIEWIRYCNNEELNLAMSLIYGTDGAVQNVPAGLEIVNKGIRLRDPAAIHLMGQLLIEGFQDI